jgi:transcription antitermination protein NusB
MATGARGARAARSAARRQCVQALYQWQLSGQPWQDIHQQFTAGEDFARCDADYFREALMAIAASRDALDAELGRHAEIPPAQLDPVEHGILYLGLWELLHRPDVPYRVVINEAIELARKFGATDGHKFVNAVLDKAAAVHRGPERGRAA